MFLFHSSSKWNMFHNIHNSKLYSSINKCIARLGLGLYPHEYVEGFNNSLSGNDSKTVVIMEVSKLLSINFVAYSMCSYSQVAY